MKRKLVWRRIGLLAAALLAGGCDEGPTEAARAAALVGGWEVTTPEFVFETPTGPRTVEMTEWWWFQSGGRVHHARQLASPTGPFLGYLAVRQGRWSTREGRLEVRIEAESWRAEPDPDLQPAPVEPRTERYGYRIEDLTLHLTAECGPLALCGNPLPLHRIPEPDRSEGSPES